MDKDNYAHYEPDDNFYRHTRNTFSIVSLVSLVAVIVIVISILVLQFSEEYVDMADALTTRWDSVEPTRGTIFSDNGQVLAVDILRYSLFFDPDAIGLHAVSGPKKEKLDSIFFLKNVDELAEALNNVYGDRSKDEYCNLLVEKFQKCAKGNVSLGNRKITAGELGKLKSMSKLMNIDRNKSGIIVQTHYKREYPSGNIARRTIGLKNDSVALTGLEKSLDDILAGKKGTQKIVRRTNNFWIPKYDVNNIPAQNGWDVHTTINVKLQDFTQKSLAAQVVDMQAEWGTAIVLDVKTGDVKAVANVTFDHKTGEPVVERYDWEFYAIQHKVEPGSTFKTVALMCMLDDKNMPMSEHYDTGRGGPKQLAKDASITDDHAVGVANVQEILEQSSNIGMAMIANRYYRNDPERLIERVEKTGIYEPLDLVIPTDIAPIHYRKGGKYWSYGGFLKMTFGYTVDMTPMHIAMFYNGLANGGVMLNPRFVTHFSDSRNHMTMDSIPVKVLNPKMCSDETLSKIKRCLEGVVINGTGKRIVGPAKFKCAGKTGTAKLSFTKSGYSGNKIKYYASFAGYFPADNPRYTVLVGIETHLDYARQRPYSGALVSGPVFRQIADFIYDSEMTPHSSSATLLDVKSQGHAEASVGDPVLLKSTASKLGIGLSLPAENGKYYGIDSLGTITRTLSDASLPDLRGFALSDALRILHEKEYSVAVVGEGSVQKCEFDDKKVTIFLR